MIVMSAGMKPSRVAKKVVRSGLARTPSIYNMLTAQPRYRLYYRLGLVHDPDLRVLRRLTPRPDPLILDVGANIGQSILSLKRLLPRSRIVSFEPNPALRNDLSRLERYFDDVTVMGFGLADRAGHFELYWPVYRGRAMFSLAALSREGATSWWGPRAIYGFNPADLAIDHAVCEVRRMDDLAVTPDIIKIDTEGAEAAIIAGGLTTIRRHRPLILVEKLSDDLASVLLDLGYRRTYAQGGRLVDSVAGKSETIFLPDDIPVAVEAPRRPMRVPSRRRA